MAGRAPGSSYRLRNQKRIASELKVSVEGSRAILVDKELAKRTAKARTTRSLKSGMFHTPDYAGGQALHEGLTAMAERSEIGDELYAQIENMDPDILAEMYADNKLTFEVVFNYEGIRQTQQGSYEVIDREGKRGDFEFLIGEYNRYVQATGRTRTV